MKTMRGFTLYPNVNTLISSIVMRKVQDTSSRNSFSTR